MLGTDYGWLTSQLDELGYSREVEEHLSIRRAVIHLFHTLDAQSPVSEEERTIIISVFAELGIGPSAGHNGTSSWTDYVVGVAVPGDTVRVRRGAYSGVGEKHNGLVGTVVAVRGGRVLVQYTGRSDGIGHAHHPDFLETLVSD